VINPQPQVHAAVRDLAVRKLRDVTVAVAIAATASVGVVAWVSAATIPGSAATTGLSGNAATGSGDPVISNNPVGFGPAPSGGKKFGPGVAVSGGSR
jgi:hypothetical protein